MNDKGDSNGVMSVEPTTNRIPRLECKDEGENDDGLLIGKLTDQDAESAFPDGRWITKVEALRIARELRVDLFEY